MVITWVQTLCEPIQRVGPERVYAFHVDGTVNGSLTDWKLFDWSQITTLCLYGSLSPELLCHAHANGARITLGNGGTGYDFTDPAVDTWVNTTVHQVQNMFVDGINIDLEVSVQLLAVSLTFGFFWLTFSHVFLTFWLTVGSLLS